MTELLRQKFRRLTFVNIDIGGDMFNRYPGSDAIVKGTYRQLCGGAFASDTEEYSLYILENGKIVNSVAWYYESELTALKNQDKEKAEKMIDQYLGIVSDDIE